MVSAPAKPQLVAGKCWQPAAPVAARSSLPDPAEARVSERDQEPAIHHNGKIAVIRKRSDFLAANRGKRFVTPGFILLMHKRQDSQGVDPDAKRYGITVTKKIGNAVARNRMKRRFRALLAEVLPQHGLAGADHIVIGRKQDREPDFAAMRADLEKGMAHLAKKLGPAC